MTAQFSFLYAAASATKPLGVWSLAGILALSFLGILIGAIALTTWLERNRHLSAESARRVTLQEEKTRIH